MGNERSAVKMLKSVGKSEVPCGTPADERYSLECGLRPAALTAKIRLDI